MSSPKRKTVIAINVQEPKEDGSSMDFGIIKGDNLRFLHQAFISDTISSALDVPDADVRLYHINLTERHRLVEIVTQYLSTHLPVEKQEIFKKHFSVHEMADEPWGTRAEKVFEDCFNNGYKQVLMLGSRTPTITSTMMGQAIKVLNKSDAVFGPTPEGRYYCLGMSGSYKVRLADHDWSSPAIYHEIADVFTDNDLKWSELEIWYCIDTTDELELLVRDINQYRFEGDETTARETEVVMERILAKLE